MSGLSRRMFARLVAAAPLAVKAASVPAATQAAQAGQMALAGVTAATGAIPRPWGGSALRDPAILQAWKLGLAPEWVTHELDRSIDDISRVLHPDVAALGSVSLSAKVQVNRRRLREAFVAKIEAQSLLDMARDAYWHKKHGVPQ